MGQLPLVSPSDPPVHEILVGVNNAIDVLQRNSDLEQIRSRARRGDAVESLVATLRREIVKVWGELCTWSRCAVARIDAPKPWVFRGMRAIKGIFMTKERVKRLSMIISWRRCWSRNIGRCWSRNIGLKASNFEEEPSINKWQGAN